jgi:enamine deaminase RidA (YjgF/YER057c/UK114 family)
MPEIREPVTGGKDWPSQYTYVPALRVGNMVWLSGTTGTDDNGKITAPGDIVEQTRQIFRKFEKLLNSIGGTCDDIVQTHDFFTTTSCRLTTSSRRRKIIKAPPRCAGNSSRNRIRPRLASLSRACCARMR